MRTEFAKLLKTVRKYNPDADVKLIRKAYRFADNAHKGQMRASGDPYISHCLGVGNNLAQLRVDANTISAGLLHDVLEDTDMTYDQLAKEFGGQIATLVEGVSNIGALNIPASLPSEQKQQQKQAENLRKMLIATARDVRVILIKLADRLHNMRTLDALEPHRIKRISQETRDIYSPLANRLGMARWKWELEDHAFHHLDPKMYREMAEQVAMKRTEREAWLKDTIEFLETRLAEAEVVARVIGRPKHLYSIYQKIVQQGKGFEQVMDILAVRIITQTVAGCYNALGIVHQVWPPVPNRFKDYIAVPKANMYQSVHTTVMRENGLSLEIQIRTEEMDRTAREGIAAHWRYKEGHDRSDQKMEDQLAWFRQMFEWLNEAHAPEELLDGVRRDVGASDVYVFTPKGEVKELPSGATPLDFAYLIHSDIGHHCIGARVNAGMVPLRYHLQTGDVVEILTSKNQTPHMDWIDLVVTGRARTRIRQKLREMGELHQPETAGPAPAKPHKRSKPAKCPPAVRQVDDATRQKLVRVQGSKSIAVQFAKCCNPMPGQAILGYITKSAGITVHRAECSHFSGTKRDTSRVIEAYWTGEMGGPTKKIGMRVSIGHRPNVLADITNAIRPINVSITQAEYCSKDSEKTYFKFVFETADKDSEQRVEATLRTVAGVIKVDKVKAAKLFGKKKMSMEHFRLVSKFKLQGDQPKAVKALAHGLREGLEHQVLLGVTGSGKTFTIANVISEVNRPALVVAHNKILAAQLYGEFKDLFPDNAVEYFVSYYDYYQPEAYIPSTDTYIEKESAINEAIDKMRHSATRALLTRRDVLIVASVSCIYGIGSPETYSAMRVDLASGETISREDLIASLVNMQYARNDVDFYRGTFRVRGDTVDIFPAYEDSVAIRVDLFGDEIDGVYEIDPLRGSVARKLQHASIFPGSHYAAETETIKTAIKNIGHELEERLKELHAAGKLLEAQRLEQRTRFDMEMMGELGYCNGIENYSRHLDGRMPGEPPYTLLNYFPDDIIVVIDESHMTVPQIGGMFKGDRSRKDKLIDYGFRLPCARDNRPLEFSEFEKTVRQCIYVSATPAAYELEKSEGLIVEQVVRPTGLVDPDVEVRPADSQVDDLLEEIRKNAERNERTLVTTLTKRMAEDLTSYLDDLQVRVRYMHSDVKTLERIEIVRALRSGEFDVLIGINLLREGLDIPEVSLVAILDADKEGYLRSESSLIQTCGRAARNVNGRVIMYANKITGSMRRAIDEMDRRRKRQKAYNKKHNITPRSIKKSITSVMQSIYERDYVTVSKVAEEPELYMPSFDLDKTIARLRKKMKTAADNMEFEKAAQYRDRILAMEKRQLEEGI